MGYRSNSRRMEEIFNLTEEQIIDQDPACQADVTLLITGGLISTVNRTRLPNLA